MVGAAPAAHAILMPASDYLSRFEERRQRGYQDMLRDASNDIAGYGGNSARTFARQSKYLGDRRSFDAGLDKEFDPDWWQKQQFEQAAAAYAPAGPPQGVRDNYTGLNREIEANRARMVEGAASDARGRAMQAPDPAPKFDSSGNLMDRTGVIDFTPHPAASTYAAPSQSFPVSQIAAPGAGVGAPQQPQDWLSRARADAFARRPRYAGTMPDTAEEAASFTPTGGMESTVGDTLTGRDGKRYRRTAVGYVGAGLSDPVPQSFPGTAPYATNRGIEDMLHNQMAEAEARQKASRVARLRGSLTVAGVRQGPYGQIPFSYGREPTQAELDYA